MHEPVPFATDDAVLAASLYAAGVPEHQPPTNTFTEDILKRLGYRGVSLIEAARAAWKRGDRGNVQYYFERTPELAPLLDAYKEQCDQINAEGESIDVGHALREIMRLAAGRTVASVVPGGTTPPISGTEGSCVPYSNSLPEVQMDEREALLRISTVTLKCRIQFVNRWKDQVPRLHIPDKGEAVTSGSTTRFPGFKNVAVNISDEKLRQLGL
jgi:hypothetical protein